MIIVKGAKPSPFARKVIITLEEKGIPYEVETLAPFPKTKELLAMHPLGKIPILQDGDVHIPDSSVIIAYLERIHPSPSVYPEDPVEYARALFFEEFSDTRMVDGIGPLPCTVTRISTLGRSSLTPSRGSSSAFFGPRLRNRGRGDTGNRPGLNEAATGSGSAP